MYMYTVCWLLLPAAGRAGGENEERRSAQSFPLRTTPSHGRTMSPKTLLTIFSSARGKLHFDHQEQLLRLRWRVPIATRAHPLTHSSTVPVCSAELWSAWPILFGGASSLPLESRSKRTILRGRCAGQRAPLLACLEPLACPPCFWERKGSRERKGRGEGGGGVASIKKKTRKWRVVWLRLVSSQHSRNFQAVSIGSRRLLLALSVFEFLVRALHFFLFAISFWHFSV